MHVVQVLLSHRIGGAESLVSALASEWETRAVSTTTVYLDPTGAKGSPFRRMAWLRSKFRSLRPDIIVGHSALPSLYARLCSPNNTPVVSVLHSAGNDFDDRKLLLAEKVLRPKTSAIVAVSAKQMKDYERIFGLNVPLKLIPNGVPGDLPRKKAYREEPLDIVSIARVARQKNPQVWISLARELMRTSSSFRLTWWGPILNDPSIECMVREWTKPDGLALFAGPTPTPGDKLLAADVFLHTADAEAHSIGILEAAAVGVPIICSDMVYEGLPEGTPGEVFAKGDVASLMAALNRMTADYKTNAARAAEFADAVRREYSVSRTAVQYLDLFDNLLSGPRGGAHAARGTIVNHGRGAAGAK